MTTLFGLFLLFAFLQPAQAQMWDELGGGVSGTGSQVKALAYNPLGPGGPTLYVGGIFSEAGGTPGFNNVGALNLITGIWTPLGTGFDGQVNALAIDPTTGDLYAGGNFDFDFTGVTEFNGVAQWNGSSWTALEVNGEQGTAGEVEALAFDANGNLYVGGTFIIPATPTVDESNIAMWNGASWTALGTGINLGTDGRVIAMVVDAQGDLYVGGTFVSVANGTVDACRVAKWDGSWSALGAGVDSQVETLTLDPLGNLYVGGGFNNAGNVFGTHCNTFPTPIEVNNIAAWDGTTWTALVDVVTDPPNVIIGLSNSVLSMTLANVLGIVGGLVVGGTFSDAGCDGFCPIGHPNDGADRVALWAPTPVLGVGVWLPLELGLNQPPQALSFAPSITIPFNSLVDVAVLAAGGSFSQAGNGTSIDRLAQFQVQLPVELTSFDALVDGRDVFLRWTTASETNNAGFEIQMHQDPVETRHGASPPSHGASPPSHGASLQVPGSAAEVDSEWQTVAFVGGHGTTREAQAYTYRIADLDPGTHRFRLKQVDFDGRFEYSAEIEVLREVPGSHVLSAVYPNPFGAAGRAAFTLALSRAQHVSVAVFDAVGRQVHTVHEGDLSAQINHRFDLNGAGLPNGLYLIRVTGEGFSDTRRVILLN